MCAHHHTKTNGLNSLHGEHTNDSLVILSCYFYGFSEDKKMRRHEAGLNRFQKTLRRLETGDSSEDFVSKYLASNVTQV